MKPPSTSVPVARNADCSSHSGGRSRVVRHARLSTRRGVRVRYLCGACRRTFVPTRGTPYYRTRRPRREFDRAMQLVVEGVSPAAVARTQRLSPSTVGRWTERAARQARRFDEETLRFDAAVELQLDELNSHGAGEHDPDWVFGAIEVWSRVWAAARVSRRTLRETLVFVRRLRTLFGSFLEPVLVTSDAFKYDLPVLRRVFGPQCVYVQMENRYRRNRILRSQPHLLLGTEGQLARALSRSEDSKKPNTAYIERLNLFKRRSCSNLHRRTPGAVRNPKRLDDALEVLRLDYNFIRPHSSLRFGKVTRTPAMQAGIFGRPLTFRQIFSWIAPPPRPLPKLVEFR